MFSMFYVVQTAAHKNHHENLKQFLIPNRYQVNNIAFGIIATKLSSLPAKSYLDSKLVLRLIHPCLYINVVGLKIKK